MTPRDPGQDPFPDLPIDPDVEPVDLAAIPARAAHLLRDRGDILVAIAVGGSLGAAARYGLARLLPHGPDELPWSTLLTNVLGCFAIGVLMVIVVRRLPNRLLVRPFFGTGVLGGFTTFSTYVVETRDLLAAGRPALAAGYLFGTLVLGLAAVIVAVRLTERVLP